MLKGKTVFVTGTNRGIGKAVLDSLVREGANVIAHARVDAPGMRDALSRMAEANGVTITPIFFDLADSVAIKQAVAELMRQGLAVDALVNCAGILHEGLLQMTPQAALRQVFEVNFFAPYYLTQLVLKIMIRNEKGGSIVNISSVAAFDGIAGETAYGASKAALAAMSKSLAKELGRHHIRVNCVAPGVVKTDLIASMSDKVLAQSEDQTYLKRLGEASDIASVVAFLVSDNARHITGQTIRVDGGLN